MGQLPGDLAGFLQAENGGVGGLGRSLILARSFAQLGGGLGDIKDVVDDLKGEADIVAEIGESLQLARSAVSAHAAKADRTGKERAGLAFVNIAEFSNGVILAFTFEISDLTGDEFQ